MEQPPKLVGPGPVVMVDDSQDDLVIAQRCYKRSRLDREFVALGGGEDLIHYLERVQKRELTMPAIVLLDINMPDMNGFDALAEIRSRPTFEELPVIMMLTNSDSPRDIERSVELGASGLQQKPLRLRDYVTFFDSLAPTSAAA